MRNEIKIQQEKVNQLLQLIKENPELKIIPLVDTEVVRSDDFSCWVAMWGKSDRSHVVL